MGRRGFALDADVEALIERLGLEAAGDQVLDYTPCQTQNASDPGVVTEGGCGPRRWSATGRRCCGAGYRGVGPGDRRRPGSANAGRRKRWRSGRVTLLGMPTGCNTRHQGFQRQGVALWQRQCGKCDSPGDQSGLKAPGTFWIPQWRLECFLFLGSQLLSAGGR